MRPEKTNAHRTLRIIGFLWVLFLAGCSAAPAPPPVEPPQKKEPEIVETRPLQAPPPSRAEPVKPNPQISAARLPDPINDDPKQLFGLDAHEVADLLGPASFVRRDGPAEVWQYRAAACVLDIYLYTESAGLRVAHVDLRKRRKATQTPRRCFIAMLSAQK